MHIFSTLFGKELHMSRTDLMQHVTEREKTPHSQHT